MLLLINVVRKKLNLKKQKTLLSIVIIFNHWLHFDRGGGKQASWALLGYTYAILKVLGNNFEILSCKGIAETKNPNIETNREQSTKYTDA